MKKNKDNLLLFGALAKNHIYVPRTAHLKKRSKKNIVKIFCYLHGTVGSWQEIPLDDLERDESEMAHKIIAKIVSDRMMGRI